MGWIPISALGLRMVEEVVHVPSDCRLGLQTPVAETVEAQGLGSQLPTTAMLPFADGVLPRHELDISSSSCSARTL